MAAHPFGPIEKVVFVTGKSLKTKIPQRGKAVFMSQKPQQAQDVPVQCDSGKESQLLYKVLQNPNFQLNVIPHRGLERTAIVDSLDNDDVFWVAQAGLHMDLLSRGLGYRITFTMPADKPFNEE